MTRTLLLLSLTWVIWTWGHSGWEHASAWVVIAALVGAALVHLYNEYRSQREWESVVEFEKQMGALR